MIKVLASVASSGTTHCTLYGRARIHGDVAAFHAYKRVEVML
jgi:hypothetical protein